MNSVPVPKYRRQKESNRCDRAFVVLSGRRYALGRYGSSESKERYRWVPPAMDKRVCEVVRALTYPPTDKLRSRLAALVRATRRGRGGGDWLEHRGTPPPPVT